MVNKELDKAWARGILKFFDGYNREPGRKRKRSLTDQQIAGLLDLEPGVYQEDNDPGLDPEILPLSDLTSRKPKKLKKHEKSFLARAVPELDEVAYPFGQYGWKGIRVFSSNSSNHVGLFEYHGPPDPQGRPPQRAIVKECRTVEGRQILAEEAVVHEKISATGSSHLVRLLARPKYRRKDGNSTVKRLIVEYCSGGSLVDLIENRIQTRTSFKEVTLWLLFRCFVDAFLVLQHGYEGEHREGEPSLVLEDDKWEPLVHLDIKPPNIFVSGHDENHVMAPRLKIGDFGNATPESHFNLGGNPDDEADPDDKAKKNTRKFNHRLTGTQGYFTPEQFSSRWDFSDWEEGGVSGNYSAATNVWGVGAVMWELITLTRGLNHQQHFTPDFQIFGKPARCRTYGKELLAYDYYSQELRFTIFECLYEKPSERITLRDLKQRITDVLDVLMPLADNDPRYRERKSDFVSPGPGAPAPPAWPKDSAPLPPQQPPIPPLLRPSLELTDDLLHPPQALPKELQIIADEIGNLQDGQTETRDGLLEDAMTFLGVHPKWRPSWYQHLERERQRLLPDARILPNLPTRLTRTFDLPLQFQNIVDRGYQFKMADASDDLEYSFLDSQKTLLLRANPQLIIQYQNYSVEMLGLQEMFEEKQERLAEVAEKQAAARKRKFEEAEGVNSGDDEDDDISTPATSPREQLRTLFPKVVLPSEIRRLAIELRNVEGQNNPDADEVTRINREVDELIGYDRNLRWEFEDWCRRGGSDDEDPFTNVPIPPRFHARAVTVPAQSQVQAQPQVPAQPQEPPSQNQQNPLYSQLSQQPAQQPTIIPPELQNLAEGLILEIVCDGDQAKIQQLTRNLEVRLFVDHREEQPLYQIILEEFITRIQNSPTVLEMGIAKFPAAQRFLDDFANRKLPGQQQQIVVAAVDQPQVPETHLDKVEQLQRQLEEAQRVNAELLAAQHAQRPHTPVQAPPVVQPPSPVQQPSHVQLPLQPEPEVHPPASVVAPQEQKPPPQQPAEEGPKQKCIWNIPIDPKKPNLGTRRCKKFAQTGSDKCFSHRNKI